MAVTASLYGLGLTHIGRGDVVFTTDTIKVALLGSGYVFAQDTHEFFSDVSASEVTGSGYTAGGQALGTKAVDYDAASNEVRYTAANTVWTAASGETLAAYGAVVYQDTGDPSTSVLLDYVDFGAEVSATGGDFTIDWDDTSGVIRLTVS